MPKTEINYSALRRTSKYPHISLDTVVTSILVGTILFVLVVLINENWGTGLLLISFFIAVVYAVNAEIKAEAAVDEKNDKSLAKFAKDNRFEFTKSSKPIDEPGTIYSHGHYRHETRILSGQFASLPMRLSDYNYTIGSGNASAEFNVRVMRLTLPRKLPHMVIDCLIDTQGPRSALPIIFDSSQKLHLEGDFYKYFTLYAPDKYAVNALTIIAPDAMEALMKMKALCDIEIIEDKIYFYWPRADIEKYKDIFTTVETVMNEIGRKLAKRDISTKISQKQIHTTPTIESVTLKKGSSLDRIPNKTLIGISLLSYVFINCLSVLLFIVTKSLFYIEYGSLIGMMLYLTVFIMLIKRTRNKGLLTKELKHRFK